MLAVRFCFLSAPIRINPLPEGAVCFNPRPRTGGVASLKTMVKAVTREPQALVWRVRWRTVAKVDSRLGVPVPPDPQLLTITHGFVGQGSSYNQKVWK